MTRKATKRILPVDYKYKTEPFKHQHKVFKLSRELEAFALFMEQGTGKTKVIIDTAAYLYKLGKITSLGVIAPKGVHRNWVEDEIEKHLPDDVPVIARWWDSGKTGTKRYQAHLNELWEDDLPYFRVFTINIDSIITKLGHSFMMKYLNSFWSLLALDESQMIKNQSAKRSKAAINLAKYAPYKRILTGTPVTQSPLDLYSQFRFLDPDILGFSSFYTFRNHYAILEEDYNWQTKNKYVTVVGFQNMDKLKKAIKPHSFRVTKDQCLDLPPKIFQAPYYVDLTKTQRRIYNQLSEELISEFQGKAITTPLAITKMLRLQQITGGFYPADNEPQIPIDKENPRVNAVVDIAEGTGQKILIWARFVEEIKAIEKALKKKFGPESTVVYYGPVKSDDRKKAERDFQNMKSKVRFFVGQPKSGGRGLNLYAAGIVLYYSNDFSLEARLQTEDRAHRHGLEHSVTYIDLVAPDTLDQKTIIPALRSKKNVADMITGDSIKEWI